MEAGVYTSVQSEQVSQVPPARPSPVCLRHPGGGTQVPELLPSDQGSVCTHSPPSWPLAPGPCHLQGAGLQSPVGLGGAERGCGQLIVSALLLGNLPHVTSERRDLPSSCPITSEPGTGKNRGHRLGLGSPSPSVGRAAPGSRGRGHGRDGCLGACTQRPSPAPLSLCLAQGRRHFCTLTMSYRPVYAPALGKTVKTVSSARPAWLRG